jgi:hypothetical protein
MSSKWTKRSVVAAIVLVGAAGRLSGCATMGSGGKMLYEPPFAFVIAATQETLNQLPVRPELVEGRITA